MQHEFHYVIVIGRGWRTWKNEPINMCLVCMMSPVVRDFSIYRRLLASWAESNNLQVCLDFLEILDFVCLKKLKIKIGLASHPINLIQLCK